ncbi:MAG: bile acid:sodium symporter family protein [Candidatus Hydrogenedentota bacterium]
MKKLNTILRVYTRTLTVWVLLFGVLAYWHPGPFVALGVHMKWFFALTMFGIGVVLQPVDFKRVVQQPWVVLVGVAAQFTIMPLGAWAVSRIFGLDPIYAVGLVLTGSAPGAMTSNVMSYVAKADAAYSVSLTAVATLLCPVLTPLLTWGLAGAQMDVPFWGMFRDLVLIVVLPLMAGFGVRNLFNQAIERIIELFPAISATFIIFICAVVIGKNTGVIPAMTGILLLAVITLNLYGMAGGYGVGLLARMRRKRRRTLAIEIGMQNAGLGVVLAQEHFAPEAALPAVFFVFLCIITASAAASYWQWRGDMESG